MRKTISFVLALFMVAGICAQTLNQYDEYQVEANNGKYKKLNVSVSAISPVQYILPEEYKDNKIVEQEVETFYSGKKTLRMQQAEDGTYILVDPERCTYTLVGKVKSDLTKRDIPTARNEEEYIEKVLPKIAEHTASFIKNAEPISDADGDWDFFELRQVGVLGFEANDSVNLDTCHLDYVFYVEKNGKYLYSSPMWGEGALRDTVAPVEMIINLSLERDSTYTFAVIDKEYNHLPGDTIYKFDFVADKSGRIEFPDSNFIKGYVEIGRVPNHALDIHYVMDMTHLYYKDVHGRNSFDDKGSPVYTFVDFNDPVHYGEWIGNAAASSAEPYFVAVGAESPGYGLKNFGSFDLLAHEYAHLVVSTNGREGLATYGEAGALNEAIADCMSVATDMYVNGDKANWEIAEGVILNGVPNMRDLSNPKMSGGGESGYIWYPQADTYGGEFWIDPNNLGVDNGGIHFNNGVFNYWFYLLTEGGSGVNDNEQSYEVEGIGIKKTEKLLMHIILNYLEPEMDYAKMRIVSQYAAIDLWGDKSEELSQVHNAWFAVGVADKTPVENVEDKLFNVYSADGNVVVEVEERSMVEIYNLVGQCLGAVEVEAGFTAIPVVEANVVIVKVGNNVQKVVIR